MHSPRLVLLLSWAMRTMGGAREVKSRTTHATLKRRFSQYTLCGRNFLEVVNYITLDDAFAAALGVNCHWCLREIIKLRSLHEQVRKRREERTDEFS